MKDLLIDKPHAEVRTLKAQHHQPEIDSKMPRLRLYRSSPYGMTLQVRVPKSKTVQYSSVGVTVDELRQMLTYAEAQWGNRS